ncbi:MAG: DUF523 domain-containing protein [Bacillota bacterium]
MYLVSACLAGVKCRHDGTAAEITHVSKMVKEGKALSVCPEVLGGLGIPRIPCEIKVVNGERVVIGEDGNDYTREFKRGAEKTLEIAKIINASTAILKAKSPSCGAGRIYDGTFSGKVIPGKGMTTELLIDNGIEVYAETEVVD